MNSPARARPALPSRVAQSRVGDRPFQCFRQRGGIAPWDQDAADSIDDYLGYPTDAGRDNGQPGRHCFKKNDAEGLEVGGENEDISRSIFAPQRLSREGSSEDYGSSNPQVPGV